MTVLLLLPTQLFQIKKLKNFIKEFNIDKIILYEHPHYFLKYNYNKKKLVLHRASMKNYETLLKKLKLKVVYKTFDDSCFIDNNYICFETIDKINLHPQPKTIIPSPNFLLSLDNFKDFNEFKKSKIIFNNFYMYGKKINNVIPHVKSLDKLNRKKIEKDVKIPNPLKFEESSYVKEAIKYVEKNFGNNIGNVRNFNYPISHTQVVKLLKYFINHKLKSFGDYQDYMVQNQPQLFHSCLSSSLNIGLIDPDDIINLIKKENVPMNSYEGFIRQLYWREYQRFCFNHFKFDKNFFGNNKNLTKKWYTGETGITPVDDCIIQGIETGYLHHIQRLMVVGNWMVLSGIKPKQGFKWFMEFSIDSYEWVMYQNVYDMLFFSTGGKTSYKPYISSSNYVLKMSDYKNDNWTSVWDKTYRDFVNFHSDKLYKFRYHFPTLKFPK